MRLPRSRSIALLPGISQIPCAMSFMKALGPSAEAVCGRLFVDRTGFHLESNGHKPEGGLEVMVRPDCIECYASEQGQGVIVEREFRGGFYLYMVALPSGHKVRCLLPHTAEYPMGASVEVKLRQGHYLRPFKDQLALTY